MQLLEFLDNHLHAFLEIIDHSLTLSGFVISMMLLIEYFHSNSRDLFLKTLRAEGIRAYLVSATLAALPGCFGCFMVVTCYIHGVISFGALITASVVTMGDLAFIVIARDPQLYFKLLLLLVVIGVVGGVLLDRSGLLKREVVGCDQLIYHEKEDGTSASVNIKHNLMNPSATRLLLIVCYTVFCLGMIGGKIGHLPSLPWINLFLSVVAISVFYVLSVASDHFIESHFMSHVFKKHFPRLFLWAALAFTLVAFLNHNPSFETFIQQKEWVIILFAILLGFVPDSGPHILFFTLYWNGQVSLAVLVASSVVQDGHGLVPLLASSGADFFKVKIVNSILAAILAVVIYKLGVQF